MASTPETVCESLGSFRSNVNVSVIVTVWAGLKVPSRRMRCKWHKSSFPVCAIRVTGKPGNTVLQLLLYISGYANDAAALEGIGLESEPFLQKPFAMDELARKVRGLLD